MKNLQLETLLEIISMKIINKESYLSKKSFSFGKNDRIYYKLDKNNKIEYLEIGKRRITEILYNRKYKKIGNFTNKNTDLKKYLNRVIKLL